MILLKNPVAIFGFPLLVFSVHALALVAGVYNDFQHFDSLMHFSGGLVAALSIYGMLGLGADRGWFGLHAPLLMRLLIVGLVGLVTIGWEVFEFYLDYFVGTEWQDSIGDTIKDQVLGVFGACVAVVRLRFQ